MKIFSLFRYIFFLILIVNSFVFAQFDFFVKDMKGYKNYSVIENKILSYIVLYPPSNKEIDDFLKSDLKIVFRKILRAYKYQNLNNLDDMFKEWEEIEILLGDDDEEIKKRVLISYAYIFFIKKEYEESLDRLNEIILDYSDFGGAYYLRANILFLLKDYEKTVEDIDYLLKNDYKFDFFILYQSYMELKEYTKAKSALDMAIEQRPNNSLLHTIRANLLWDEGKYEESFLDYKKAMTQKPSDRIYFGISKYYYYKKQYKEALNFINKAILLNDDNFIYFYFKALVEKKDYPTQALKDFEYSLELIGSEENEYKNKIYKELVIVSALVRDYVKLLLYSKTLYRRDSTYENLYYRATAYFFSEMYGNAIMDYSDLMKLKGEYNEDIIIGRGISYLKSMKYELAIKDLLKVHKMNKKNIDVINGIIFSYFLYLKLKKVIPFIKKGIKLIPNEGKYYFLLGIVDIYMSKKKIITLNKNIKKALSFNFKIEKWLTTNEGFYLYNMSEFKTILNDLRKRLNEKDI